MELALDNKLVRDLIATLVLLVLVVLVRAFLLRLVRTGSEILSEDQRRWTVSIKNGTWAILILGLFFLWAPQLQTLALSVTAFAVAVVLATREVIACLVGGVVRAGTQPFKVGDWVTIEGVTGEVVDLRAMGVVLQQVDVAGHTYHYTGQTHYVPNVKLLTASYSRSPFTKKFVYQDVPVVIQHVLHGDLDPEQLVTRFAEIAEKHFAPHREEAAAFVDEMRRRTHVEVDAAEPRVFLRSTEHSHYVLTARVLLPTRQAAQIASDMTRELVSLVHQEKQPKVVPAA